MNTIEELNDYLKINGIESSRYLSEVETIPAIIGFDVESGALVYEKDKLVECFMEHFRESDSDELIDDEELYNTALEWVEYNTIRSLPYEDEDYVVYDKYGETVAFYPVNDSAAKDDAEARAKEIDGYVELVHYVNPIIIEGCTNWNEFCDSTKDYIFDAKNVEKDCIEWVKNWWKEYGEDKKATIDLSKGYNAHVLMAICVEALGAENVIGIGNRYQDSDICDKLGVKYIESYSPIQSNYLLHDNAFLVSSKSFSDKFIGTNALNLDGYVRPFGSLTNTEISAIGKCLLGMENDTLQTEKMDTYIRTGKASSSQEIKEWTDEHFKNVYWERMIQLPSYDGDFPVHI